MLKNKKLLGVLLLLAVSACTTLSKDDRKLLIDTKNMAEEAKYMSQQAMVKADDAAESARLSSERAERIFKQSQKK